MNSGRTVTAIGLRNHWKARLGSVGSISRKLWRAAVIKPEGVRVRRARHRIGKLYNHRLAARALQDDVQI